MGEHTGTSSREGNLAIASKTTRRLTFTYNPSNLLAGVYHIDIPARAQNDICMRLFTTVLLTPEKDWK